MAMPRILEPDLLQSFVAIAETGSFTEAARRVHRTQSAVSMQIRRLEELLGRPVFLRNGRSVALTQDGDLLLGHARRILRAHGEAIAAFDGSELQGRVTIGTPDQYATAFLPGILARFAETHPRVHVEVACDISNTLRAQLGDGTLDLALLTCSPGDEDGVGGGVVVLEEPLVWATSARHCAHERTPVPLALFHQGCVYRRSAVEALAALERPYRIAYTSMSMAGIMAAVRAGLAVSALPRFSLVEQLRILGERDGFPPLPSYRVTLMRGRDRRSPVLDRLEEHIIDNFAAAVPPAAAAA